MTPVGILVAAFASALAGAQATTPDHRADIKRAVFELCPKIYAGEVGLTDPAQLSEIGYTATAPRKVANGTVPRAEMGEGAAKIVLAGQAGTEPSCTIWFGGSDTNEQLGYMLTDASASGFSISDPMSLGDGTMLLKAVRKQGAYKTMVVIVGDAGGEFGSNPAATVILMK
ncbi:hypothetical protein HNP52_001527 [Sphingomonas kyeonggiensis]|uniref:Uncharacterized protein n=1 Tax=Sphingomonas kyeonggiensis TaxID=1268553 RepID=A0A7W7K0J6_9SPHN|nr:hypothetical protein [Sphingomonas kyeonggiensis]MBB4838476.1 hypothetical protein [Sphingomonas kyeonggiensis]